MFCFLRKKHNNFNPSLLKIPKIFNVSFFFKKNTANLHISRSFSVQSIVSTVLRQSLNLISHSSSINPQPSSFSPHPAKKGRCLSTDPHQISHSFLNLTTSSSSTFVQATTASYSTSGPRIRSVSARNSSSCSFSSIFITNSLYVGRCDAVKPRYRS